MPFNWIADMEQDELNDDKPTFIQERACEACGRVLPLTERHFPRRVGTQHEFQHVCKSCVRAQRAKQRIARAETRATETFLAEVAPRRGGSNIPHTSELLESVYTLFGGVNGVANAMALQYHAAPPGGRIRTAILESIVRLTTKAAESGTTSKPISLMSDEELEQRLAQKLQMAADAQKNLSVLREADVEIPVGLISLGSQVPEEDFAKAQSMRSLVEGKADVEPA